MFVHDDTSLVQEIFKNHSELLTSPANNWLVFVGNSEDDQITCIYNRSDYKKAVEVANFWDERISTYHIQVAEIMSISQRIRDNMTKEQKIDEYVEEALARMNSMVDYMNAK